MANRQYDSAGQLSKSAEQPNLAPERVQKAARWIARHWKGTTAFVVGTAVSAGGVVAIESHLREQEGTHIESAFDTINGATNDVFVLRPGVNLRTDPSINNDRSTTNVVTTVPEGGAVVVYGAGESSAHPGWIAFRAPQEAALSGPNEETNRQEALHTVWVNIDAIEGSHPDLITRIDVVDPAAGTQGSADFGIDYATSDEMTLQEGAKLANFMTGNLGPTQSN